MIVIQTENLWKEYRLGVIGHGTLTHDLQSWWARIRGKEDPNARLAPMLKGQHKKIDGDRFWALQNINLDVKQGEVLGIIGKNGAGKSTLLKILSRVTAPTKGNIKVKGRIASLLEVGTGFHPELTGRENVFLNGAILGMSKQEVNRKFHEIVEFSGIEIFIDTPVKRYSSGMYVRLAFAVAAHLEPEILIIDEVLAVGDSEFQNKCLGKMNDVAHEGRTVLFVSHNLPMLGKLCPKSILLENGKIVATGNSEDVIEKYLGNISQSGTRDLSRIVDRKGCGNVLLTEVLFLDENMHELDTVQTGKPLIIRVCFDIKSNFKYRTSRFSVLISNMSHGLVNLDTSVARVGDLSLEKSGFVDFIIKKLPLSTGKYNTGVFVEAGGDVQDWVQIGPPLIVEGGTFFDSGRNCVFGFEGKQILVEHDVKLSWQG